MNIADLLNPATFANDMMATNKNEALAELVDALIRVEKELNGEEVIRVLQERELLGSTGIGHGVAIPHGKLKSINRMIISFGRSQVGIDFESMDDLPANLFFLLLAPDDSAGEHLKTLARICKLMKDLEIRQRVLKATQGEDVYQIICDEEKKL